MKPSKDMLPTSWRVWARVTGPQLPLSDYRIGNATFGPGPAGYRPPGPSAAPVLKHPKGTTSFSATAPSMKIDSDCWIVVTDVRAPTADAAVAKARAETIVPLVAALSAGNLNSPYRAVIWGTDDGHEGSSYTGVVKTAMYSIEDLDSARLSEARSRVELARANKHLGIASELFYRGVEYSDFTAGAATEASSLLSFYQVLEACAQVVKWVLPEDYEDECNLIARELAKSLARKSLVKNTNKAIHAASDSLKRLDARFVNQRIEHAALTFGLDRRWINRAHDLGKFRNSRLSHPSNLPSLTEMSQWGQHKGEESAYALASSMLAAAFRYELVPPTPESL